MALLIAAACSRDPLSSDEKLVGAYNLVSIDGQPLPHSFVDAGQPVTIVSRQLLVMKNGPFPTAYWTDSSPLSHLFRGRSSELFCQPFFSFGTRTAHNIYAILWACQAIPETPYD